MSRKKWTINLYSHANGLDYTSKPLLIATLTRANLMKIKPAYLIALLISLLIVGWFIYGSILRDDKSTTVATDTNATETQEIPTVKIQTITAELHDNYMDLYGRSEANREVAVKAETAGLVVKTPVREGKKVKRGTLLCAQDVDARQAMLDQANALYRSRELEYKAAQALVDKGFRSPTQALGAQAALDGAKASVKQAEIELGNVIMRAPFDGVFEQQIAEIGDYLSPGQPCGLLVDLDPLVVTGEVTEKQVGLLKIGQKSQVSLATGEQLTGIVHFIESRANPATRTFKIEVEVPNTSGSLKAGVTANLKISAGQTYAHLIPSSVLTLDDVGSIGVRYLGEKQTVRFARVETIDETSDGIWVTGLPAKVDLIIRGQDYVSEGTQVRTQYGKQ